MSDVPERPFVPTRDDLRDLYFSDPTVHSILGWASPEDCILALAREKQELQERIKFLESICPKKVQTEDGRIYIYHCPDELIPVRNI